MEYAIAAAFALAIIRLLVKIFQKPLEGEVPIRVDPPEEPTKDEPVTVEVDATVVELGCYVEMTGIQTPHTGKVFEAVFETDDRQLLKFRIPQEMYDGLEKGLRGRLTYVDEALYSFEPDEEEA